MEESSLDCRFGLSGAGRWNREREENREYEIRGTYKMTNVVNGVGIS